MIRLSTMLPPLVRYVHGMELLLFSWKNSSEYRAVMRGAMSALGIKRWVGWILAFAAAFVCIDAMAHECVDGPQPDMPDTPEIAALRKEQRELVDQVRQELAEEESKKNPSPASAKRVAELKSLLKEMVSYLEREKATRLIGRHTVLEPYCSYYARFARRLEDAGSSSFPKENGKSVYGSVIVRVTLNRSGGIERTRVSKSSSKILEDHTIALIRSLAPFEPIPAGVKEDYFELGASYNYQKD